MGIAQNKFLKSLLIVSDKVIACTYNTVIFLFLNRCHGIKRLRQLHSEVIRPETIVSWHNRIALQFEG